MTYEIMEWSDLKRAQKDQTSVFAFCTLYVAQPNERVDSYGDMVKIINRRMEDPAKVMEAYFTFENMLKKIRCYVLLKDERVVAFVFRRNDGSWVSNVQNLQGNDLNELRRHVGPGVWRQISGAA